MIPKLQVLSENDSGLNNKAQGLNIKAGFQRVGDKMYLEMAFENKSNTSFSVTFIVFRIWLLSLTPTLSL